MNARQMERQAEKLEAQQKPARKKIAEFVNKYEMEKAKICAETVSRQKRESTNLRRFGAKVTALSQKLEGAKETKEVSEIVPIM